MPNDALVSDVSITKAKAGTFENLPNSIENTNAYGSSVNTSNFMNLLESAIQEGDEDKIEELISERLVFSQLHLVIFLRTLVRQILFHVDLNTRPSISSFAKFISVQTKRPKSASSMKCLSNVKIQAIGMSSVLVLEKE